MSITIAQMVPEVRERIYKFCDVTDLVSIACCSKEYYETVKYILWNFLKVKWKLMQNKEVVIEKTRHLDMTVHLYFYTYQRINDEEDKDAIAASYEYIIKTCNPDTMYSLHFTRYMVNNGLTLASQILPNLKVFSLSDIKIDTSDILEWDYICTFKQIRRLSIYSSNLPDSSLKNICSLLDLDELIIVNCKEITCGALKHICEAPNLRKLNFSNHRNNNSVTSEGYAYAAKLVDLVELNFSYSDIDHAPFVDIGETLKYVTVLDLTACFHLSGRALPYISKMVALKQLDISYCQEITDDSLKHLSALTELYWLSVGGIRSITDKGLFNLSKVMSLKQLNLSACSNITNAGLFHLHKLLLLHLLNIWRCENITDDGMMYISNIRSLTNLNIGYCKNIKDSGIFHLTKLSSLKWLHMLGCALVTDNGLSHLSKVVSLTELDISYCDNYTDSGLLEIQSLRALRCLNIFGCKKITDEGIVEIKNLLPRSMKLNIDKVRKK